MRLNPFAETPQPPPNSERGGGEDDDYGFGEKLAGQGVRLLDKDGNFNVRRAGQNTRFLYKWLIEMPWKGFFACVLGYYVAVNLLLGLVFFALGSEGIGGVSKGPWYERLADCFFFSVQTFTTVGYGSMAPEAMVQQIVAALGALIGLMSVALATGLFFARFSRPRKLVVFSDLAVIAPYKDVTAFMFRLANRSSSKLINVTAQVVYSWVNEDESGERTRRFTALPLERGEIAMFPLNWTVVHPITSDSPLSEINDEGVRLSDGEFIVQISGFDETYARRVYAHTSYRAECMQWGKRFRPMYHPAEDGSITLHIDRINAVEDATIVADQVYVEPEELVAEDELPTTG